jgi:long-chain acyl-CoA synthetase
VNVYPQEIEAALRSAPGVHDCAVVGIPDRHFGERPVAFIVADRNAPSRADVIESVRLHIESRLGRIKRPDSIHIVGALPYSPTGKLLRRKLREFIPTIEE